ncbi:DUF3987 domain-containing protein [Mesorhizobium helmanticense]|nr:DUF3987 domain-containing protein [Mesorhizobium helmanticense]
MTTAQPKTEINREAALAWHQRFGGRFVEENGEYSVLEYVTTLGNVLSVRFKDGKSIAIKAANDNLPSVPAPTMHPEPFRPDAAGGLLCDMSKWITSTAIIASPELSLVSSIALIAGLFGKKCLGPTSAGINVYLTTLLATAGGKGHPPKAIRGLADAVGGIGAVTNGDPTSYAAIERMLRKNTSTVIVMDEFGITLQDVNAKHRNSVAASIRKFLLAVYDQANSSFDGRIYASSDTKKDDGPIQGPALTVLGMTTGDTLYQGLSEASISDGFLNRFLFITATAPAGPPSPPRLHRDAKPPTALIEALRCAVTVFPKAGFAGTGKVTIPFDGGEEGDAYKRWAEVFMWQHHAAWSEVQRNINGRAAENTIRLATIRAISREPAAPSLNVDDVGWAWAIVHQSILLITEGVSRHMSASPAEALRKAIIEALRAAPGETLAFAHLMQRKGVSGADMRELEGALHWLLESGEITDIASRAKPGRGSKFRLNPVVTT